MWVTTVDEKGRNWNFNLDNTWTVRDHNDTGIRFRERASGDNYIDVYYKSKDVRDAELKKIQNVMHRRNHHVG